jgi:hypothetical protein
METESRLQTEARTMRRFRALGDNPSCALCGESNPEALTSIKRSLFENHHVGGDANDPDLTVVLCLNHHRIATERQRQCGVDLCHRQKDTLERLINILKGLASFLLLAGEVLLAWVERLSNERLK